MKIWWYETGMNQKSLKSNPLQDGSKIPPSTSTLPRASTAEHYADKASELLFELRQADKRWEQREVEYQQDVLQMSTYVNQVYCPAQ